VIHALVLGATTGVRVGGWGGLARDGRGNDEREGAKNHLHSEISDT
jgi:hypothetical protein